MLNTTLYMQLHMGLQTEVGKVFEVGLVSHQLYFPEFA